MEWEVQNPDEESKTSVGGLHLQNVTKVGLKRDP